MEADNKVVIALATIAGSAIMGSIGYLIKSGNESRRAVRKVLYYLLEIRHGMASNYLDVEEEADRFITNATEKLAKKLGPTNGATLPIDMRETITDHFRNMFEASRAEINQEFIGPFHDALLELAQSHPILAFQMRGQEKYKEIFALTNQYDLNVAQLYRVQIERATISSAMQRQSKLSKRKVLDGIVSNLDADILRVAWASSGWDWVRCKLLLRRLGKKTHSVVVSDVDSAIDELVDVVQMALRADAESATLSVESMSVVTN